MQHVEVNHSIVRKLLFNLLSYEDYISILERNTQLYSSLEKIGESSRKRPIYAVKVGSGYAKILVIAGVHSNEPAPINAVLLALLLFNGLYQVNPYYMLRKYIKNMTIALIPILNPEGYIRYFDCITRSPEPSWSNTCEEARVNENNVDLNRDWMFLTQQETRALHSFINTFKPDIIIELHEFYAGKMSPPRWASEVLDFMVTLTDSPYEWVNESIRHVSRNLAEYVASSIKPVLGDSWPIKYRHFIGGANKEEKKAYPSPATLGAHVAIEHYPKLLVETWGVGLHKYLLYDRVTAHLYAILGAIDYLYQNVDHVRKAKHDAVNEDASVYGSLYREFVIKGHDLELALQILGAHGIVYSRGDGKAVIQSSLQPGLNKIALLLLDEDNDYNRELERSKRGPYTLNRVLDVSIEKH